MLSSPMCLHKPTRDIVGIIRNFVIFLAYSLKELLTPFVISNFFFFYGSKKPPPYLCNTCKPTAKPIYSHSFKNNNNYRYYTRLSTKLKTSKSFQTTIDFKNTTTLSKNVAAKQNILFY